MCRRSPSQYLRPTAAAAALIGMTLLGGCSGGEPDQRAADTSPTDSADEVSPHGGEVCPRRLPPAENPGTGLGTEEPAAGAPSLPTPESAWTCEYRPVDSGPGPDGQGTALEWERAGEARPVSSSALPDIADHLTRLTPPEAANQMCTMDLGPRWMLVYPSGQDLTGVVVDDFGCRSVRLTDDPFETAPGASEDPDISAGLLTSPPGLLDDVKAAHAG